MNEIFTIGSFCFRLICPGDLQLPTNFLKFRGGDDPAYTYTIEYTDDLPAPEGHLLHQGSHALILEREGREVRYIGRHACCMEESDNSARILLLRLMGDAMTIDTMFCAMLSLERRQLVLDSLILHCAFVEYQGEAILFSAPSETGKTTQANLWQRHRGAQTVNGDRCLLQKLYGRWYARGWPVCGSSGVCENRDVPIRAVVMLSQSPQDRAARLSPMKAFSQIYSQITINRWNKAANLKAMGLLENLIEEVPVYHLACTMNESAVETLETALRESR